MKVELQKEHEWLRKLDGEWTYESGDAHGDPSSKAQGSETVRSIEGVWSVAEGRGTMPGGGDATTIMTLGYDPQTKRFVGTWIGSMLAYLWVYDGELDATGKVLTLNSDGPSMAGDGKMAKYQDIIEFKSDDYRTLTARVQGEDGQWKQIMSVHYRRKA